MTTSRDTLDTDPFDDPLIETETIVHINDDGRIVIPRDVRRVLDVEGEQAKITVYYDGNSAQSIIDIDQSGRATIPVQLRRYLGINGEELDLRVDISRVDSTSHSDKN